MLLKVCGITRLVDARLAIDEGATALGFVFWPKSPRFVSDRSVAEIVAAVPPSVATVGVFVNQSPEWIAQTVERTGVSTVQLHGDEPAAHLAALSLSPSRIWRSLTLETAGDIIASWDADTTFLLDAADRERRGGTGQTVNWAKAAGLARRRRIVLAGGLTPENVETAIAAVHPYGIDVSSGVEDAPGVKNPHKLARFLSNARTAMAHTETS